MNLDFNAYVVDSVEREHEGSLLTKVTLVCHHPDWAGDRVLISFTGDAIPDRFERLGVMDKIDISLRLTGDEA